jgi:deazaflavin-dependent oxidoreductase (nitroreductase family)
MAGAGSALSDRLSRYREIRITVIGRKSGKKISVPVWFVTDGTQLHLLPVQGSDTQWYKNLQQNPSIRIEARGEAAEFRGIPISDGQAVASVVERFRQKYGAKDVKRYYSKFDVAVLVKPA